MDSSGEIFSEFEVEMTSVSWHLYDSASLIRFRNQELPSLDYPRIRQIMHSYITTEMLMIKFGDSSCDVLMVHMTIEMILSAGLPSCV